MPEMTEFHLEQDEEGSMLKQACLGLLATMLCLWLCGELILARTVKHRVKKPQLLVLTPPAKAAISSIYSMFSSQPLACLVVAAQSTCLLFTEQAAGS